MNTTVPSISLEIFSNLANACLFERHEMPFQLKYCKRKCSFRLAGYVEAVAVKLGFDVPPMSTRQANMWKTKYAAYFVSFLFTIQFSLANILVVVIMRFLTDSRTLIG